ncbi:hypothetical protein NKG94_37100 [Micromonospora sp. M12]
MGATAAVIAVLVPAFLSARNCCGAVKPSPAGSTPAGSPATSGPAVTASTSPSGKPTASPSASLDRTGAMLAGQRRFLLHAVEIDRDLSLPSHGEVEVGDGTGRTRSSCSNRSVSTT